MATAKTFRTNLKHLEVARKALNCVDLDCLERSTAVDNEYAEEMFQQWQKAMYAIDELIDVFTMAQYEADNPA